MFSIEKCDYGYAITFSGMIDATEMRRWVDESKRSLAMARSNFGVTVDMRNLSPLPSDAQTALEEGQKLFKTAGMIRSAVVVSKGYVATELRLLARSTGIGQWERYIDASGRPEWKEAARAWASDGKDPDQS